MPGPAEDREFHGLTDDLAVDAVQNPQDQDVLCGRGGAALRHPGNQTYRRLVHLNKALYITCLKQEKLKISRSIVAAIREQNGRFLERDTQAAIEQWYDIGDKKAMEKTSQALREGQPKLRRRMEEAGGGIAGAQAIMRGQMQSAASGAVGASNQHANSNNGGGGYHHHAASMQNNHHQQQQQQQQQHHNMQHSMQDPMQQYQDTMASGDTHNVMGSMEQMPPPPNPFAMSDSHHATANIYDHPTIEEEPGNTVQGFQQRVSLTHPRGSAVGHELGMVQSQLSLMSDFSNFSQPSLNAHGGVNGGIPGPPESSPMSTLSHQHQQLPSIAAPIESPAISISSQASQMRRGLGGPGGGIGGVGGGDRMDRRKYYASMKYSRPPSGRFKSGSNRNLFASNRSLKSANSGDGMPDIHLVESNPSLFSGPHRTDSIGAQPAPPSQVSNVFESRRSLMSGLSRISDSSDAMNSIFSDLSRKIGNVSTRSIAMSEISNMDNYDERSIDDDEPFDHIEQTVSMEDQKYPAAATHAQV